MQAAVSTAVPLAYLIAGRFRRLKVKNISLRLESFESKKDVNIADVFLSRKEAKPGETIELMVQLDGENGADLSRTLKYQIPPGTAPGTLYFTVADGPQTSILELRQIAGETAHSPDQLISMVNRLRPSDKLICGSGVRSRVPGCRRGIAGTRRRRFHWCSAAPRV